VIDDLPEGAANDVLRRLWHSLGIRESVNTPENRNLVAPPKPTAEPEPADEPELLEVVQAGPMLLLPAPPGHCALCAVKHQEHEMHDARSLFYGMRFQMKHGRSPRWADAVAHCPDLVRRVCVEVLTQHGFWKAADQAALDAGEVIAEPTLIQPKV
jgi:hypothetical protein